MDQPEDRPAPAAEGRRPPRRAGPAVLRLFGIPVHVSPLWLIFAGLVIAVYGAQLDALRPGLGTVAGYALGGAFVLCLLGSVLVHELGHALAGRRLGVGVRSITLGLLVGHTELEREAPRPRVDALVALAGPAASLGLAVFAGGLALVLPDDAVAVRFATQVAVSNAIIAGFNALPGLPLDGGVVLQAAVWAASGDQHRARRIAGWAGRVLATSCVAAAVGLSTAAGLSLVGLLVAVVMAASIWRGASDAVALGRAGARWQRVDLSRLARPVLPVPSGTPLGEALRRAAEAGLPDAALVVVDAARRPCSVVHDAAAAAVPPERRAAVAVDDLARQVDAHPVGPAEACGGNLLWAVGVDPVGEYLVTAGEDVVGILRVADLDRVLQP